MHFLAPHNPLALHDPLVLWFYIILWSYIRLSPALIAPLSPALPCSLSHASWIFVMKIDDNLQKILQNL